MTSTQSRPFDLDHFLADLGELIAIPTIVSGDPGPFAEIRAWVLDRLHGADVEVESIDCHGVISTLIKPTGSQKPRILCDGHLEVVPGSRGQFAMKIEDGWAWGRGVADMKAQCLFMLQSLQELWGQGLAQDVWLLFTEDEEAGSACGAKVVAELLKNRNQLPDIVFAPDGGQDFAFVEKEKGIGSFTVHASGTPAHGSRPWLGTSAIESLYEVRGALARFFPNPQSEQDWRPSLTMTRVVGGEANNRIAGAAKGTFDLRFTESWSPVAIRNRIDEVVTGAGASADWHSVEPATFYPRDDSRNSPYIALLREILGRPPIIQHAAGASNGRVWVAADPDIQVWMTSPVVAGSHGDDERVRLDSLEPYSRLVTEALTLPFGPSVS